MVNEMDELHKRLSKTLVCSKQWIAFVLQVREVNSINKTNKEVVPFVMASLMFARCFIEFLFYLEIKQK